MSFPRILFLTPGAIDFPFGSGEVLREIVRAMPEGSVAWASLRKGKMDRAETASASQSFPLEQRVKWRVGRTRFGSLALKEISVGRRARQIAQWAGEFDPELLWILAEEDAVSMGCHLQRRLGVPIHLTFHDAPEVLTRMFGHYHLLVRAVYITRLRRLLGAAGSVDAISLELVEHVDRIAGRDRNRRTLVFPPSVSGRSVTAVGRARAFDEGCIRRIAFCGSLRTSAVQWQRFLGTLAELPFRFSFFVFADVDYFPEGPLPENVTITMPAFAATEQAVRRVFVDEGIHACYLGLYREKEWALFCRTSLSSKLSTYAAMGAPIIVDGPEESVAWRLVEKYGAGVLCGEGAPAVEQLRTLFGDRDVWQQMADGASRMFEEEFDLDENIERFKDCLMITAGGH